MTVFRPCIDLHNGQVKQIVGGSLRDTGPGPRENFVAEHGAAWFAERYRSDQLGGGHVIKLGPGNDEAARAALAAWPDGLHVGGGMTIDNAADWIAAGAEKVIVTSWLVDGDVLSIDRARALAAVIGRERLVIDLSCRRLTHGGWAVAVDRWQRVIATEVNQASLAAFAEHCSEFLIHAADVEGLCQGIDGDLVSALGAWSPIPVTYAGGGRHIDDLAEVEQRSNGRVDLTFGSALDLFGGSGVAYNDCLHWNRQRPAGQLPSEPED